MCVSPNTFPDGRSVSCRKCWQCRENRINDWVGRCIAEKNTAAAAHSITLTYGRDSSGSPDHVRSALLTYSDVQKYFKRLRIGKAKGQAQGRSYQFRYFIAGEYGTLKGRAHWHAVIFWDEAVPPHILRKNFDEPFWDHGTSFWDDPSPASIRYVCKYINKDQGKDERQGYYAMSRRPPVGAQYFDTLARDHAKAGLSPQRPFYSFPGVNDSEGNRIEFHLKGPSLDNFIQSFIDWWGQIHGGDAFPHSDMIDEYLDRIQPERLELLLDPLPGRLIYPWREPPSGRIQFSEAHNSYCATQLDGTLLFWSFNTQGDRSWQNVIRGANHPVSPLVDYRAASAPSLRRARVSSHQ